MNKADCVLLNELRDRCIQWGFEVTIVVDITNDWLVVLTSIEYNCAVDEEVPVTIVSRGDKLLETLAHAVRAAVDLVEEPPDDSDAN